MDDSQRLTILTGPTAVGKTARALDWAEREGAEIVSCDSLLVYRGMDIGTAKPTAAELARVPHHLIDIAPVNQQLSVVDYLTQARAAVRDIHQRGKRVLITGGSGFYLKGFLAAVADDIAVPAELRKQVRALEAEQGLAGLLEALRAASPSGMDQIDLQNPRRVARALERCLASGKSIPQVAQEFAEKPGAFDDYAKHIILLSRGEEALQARIEARTQAMLDAGLIEEVEQLCQQGLEDNPSAAGAIGYRETLAYLNGELARADLVPAISQNTRRLVAKQRKWFRNQLTPDEVIELDAQ